MGGRVSPHAEHGIFDSQLPIARRAIPRPNLAKSGCSLMDR
jgi:hypothetical protein